jgi:HlyD family secretion protein
MVLIKRWWGIALLIFLILFGLASWRLWQGAPADAIRVQVSPLVRTLQFSARVATRSRVDLGSTLTARVAAVRVREGQQVLQGDILIEMEPDELQSALVQAQASELQAQARLNGLKTTGRSSVLAGLAQARATLQAAEADLSRTRQLVAQGFLSDSRLDEIQRTVEVSRAQAANAQAQIVANADAGTDLVQAQAQLEVARAAVLAARSRLAQVKVRAPADARVLSRTVEPGQIVQPGRALMSLALVGPTQLTAQVDERFLDQLRVGQLASVVADAFSAQRFAARVLSIAPAVDPQRGAVELKFELLQAPPAYLREDMTLSVEVETARREQALVVPVAALRSPISDASASVRVLHEGRVQARSVRLGLRTMEAVEVLEGLQAGETVLLSGKQEAGDRAQAKWLTWPAKP